MILAELKSFVKLFKTFRFEEERKISSSKTGLQCIKICNGPVYVCVNVFLQEMTENKHTVHVTRVTQIYKSAGS